ncbi:MAG: peptidoglycan DD-metalloendopeptidase family protein [Nitrospirota bacterium]
MVFLFPFLLPASHCSLAETPQEEYKQIQKEIRSQKRKIEQTRKKESSVLSEIENINKQLKIVESDLRKYRKRLQATESQIARVESEIAEKKRKIESHREWIKQKIRSIHKYGNYTDTMMLFMSAEDISQVMRNIKYLQFIATSENRVLNDYKANLENLTIQEKKLVTLKKELSRNREKVSAEEQSLAEKKEDREILLVSVKKEKSSYTKMLKEMEQASKKLLEIIRESERAERERREILSDKNFSTLKGKLPWPVDGRIVVRYGSQKDPQFNTPIFRSGTFIEATPDAMARSVHGGKVVFAEWFKGYGQLVILNHGDGYHSLYGSLSEIFANVGDIIKEMHVIGRVGNSGIVNSDGLYFEIRYKGKPLDPLQWLQRR